MNGDSKLEQRIAADDKKENRERMKRDRDTM